MIFLNSEIRNSRECLQLDKKYNHKQYNKAYMHIFLKENDVLYYHSQENETRKWNKIAQNRKGGNNIVVSHRL